MGKRAGGGRGAKGRGKGSKGAEDYCDGVRADRLWGVRWGAKVSNEADFFQEIRENSRNIPIWGPRGSGGSFVL